MSQPQQPKAAPTNNQNSLYEDWLDKVLEQYWKQRHGMYNANQDDVEMANREAKDAIANKIVVLILKDRAAINKTIMEDVLDCLPRVSDLDSPLQQSWKLGGTDEESFRRGFLQALTAVRQQITTKYGRADNE